MLLMPIGAGPMQSAEQAAELRKLVQARVLGGGVLATDDCQRTYEALKGRGVVFVREPKGRRTASRRSSTTIRATSSA